MTMLSKIKKMSIPMKDWISMAIVILIDVVTGIVFNLIDGLPLFDLDYAQLFKVMFSMFMIAPFVQIFGLYISPKLLDKNK